mgnify:CR=1 FL=1|jgi:hypothetical protein
MEIFLFLAGIGILFGTATGILPLSIALFFVWAGEHYDKVVLHRKEAVEGKIKLAQIELQIQQAKNSSQPNSQFPKRY